MGHRSCCKRCLHTPPVSMASSSGNPGVSGRQSLVSPESPGILEDLSELGRIHKQLLWDASTEDAGASCTPSIVGGNGRVWHLTDGHLGPCREEVQGRV